MRAWRDRGVVQDSDEDPDLEESQVAETSGEATSLKSSHTSQGPIAQHSQTTRERDEEFEVSAEQRFRLPADSKHDSSTGSRHSSPIVGRDDYEESPITRRNFSITSSSISARNALKDAQISKDIEWATLTAGNQEDKQQARNAFDIPSSIHSSPLSSPASAPETPPLLRAPPLRKGFPIVVVEAAAKDVSRPQVQEKKAEGAAQSTVGRSFRQRNPIQLHPYLLESEQYRNSLRSRGLQPVAFRSNEYHLSTDQRHESQFAAPEVGIETSDDSDFAARSSHFSSPSVSRWFPATGPNVQGSDEEFPDLATLGRRSLHGQVHEGFKKRKLSKALQPVGQRKQDDAATETTSMPSQSRNAADKSVLPRSSPSNEYSKTRGIRRPRFKVPRGFAAESLPTPEPSSESHHPIPSIPPSQASSDTDIDVVRHVTIDDHPSPKVPWMSPLLSPDADTASEDPESSRWKKKIKGVLPASWLRLDQQENL